VILAADYLGSLGVTVPPITVYAYEALENISPDWDSISKATGQTESQLIERRGRSVGEALPSTIILMTGADEWRSMIDVHKLRLVIHEYFHVAQFRLAGSAATRSFFASTAHYNTVLGPNWLLEGSAEYFSWRVMQNAELVSLDDYLRLLDTKEDVDPEGLETYLEFFSAGQNSYDASLRAVAFLIRDNDEQDLMRYFFEIGQSRAWPLAFASSFGKTLDAFYRQYGAYMASR
jgi:hypothetical protein